MKTRKEKWLEKGYTPEQIENHLRFERYKAKLARERRERNNENNQNIIYKIKTDLLGITFRFEHKEVEVLKISPSTDGKGFWYRYKATYNDGSSGEFRQFFYFDDYVLNDFIEDLRL